MAKSKLCISKTDNGGISVRVETPRLIIETVKAGDEKELYLNLYDRPEIADYLSQGIRAPAEVKRQVAKEVGESAKGNPYTCMTIRDKSGAFIGILGLQYQPLSGSLYLSYGIAPESQRKGYAREAVGMVLKHAVPVLKAYGFCEDGALKHISAIVLPENDKSLNLLRDMNFKEYASMPVRVVDHPDYHGALVMRTLISAICPEQSWQAFVIRSGVTFHEEFGPER